MSGATVCDSTLAKTDGALRQQLCPTIAVAQDSRLAVSAFRMHVAVLEFLSAGVANTLDLHFE